MEDVETVVRAYVASAGPDMSRAATFFEEPATFVGIKFFFLMQTKAEVIKFLDWSSEAVRPLGFSKSTCEYLSVKMLNPVVALTSVIYSRQTSDGIELQRSGVTYILRKGNHGWKIRNVLPTDLAYLENSEAAG